MEPVTTLQDTHLSAAGCTGQTPRCPSARVLGRLQGYLRSMSLHSLPQRTRQGSGLQDPWLPHAWFQRVQSEGVSPSINAVTRQGGWTGGPVRCQLPSPRRSPSLKAMQRPHTHTIINVYYRKGRFADEPQGPPCNPIIQSHSTSQLWTTPSQRETGSGAGVWHALTACQVCPTNPPGMLSRT